MAASTLTIEIRQHPTSAAHKIAKVIARGRVYAVTYTEPFPSEEKVRELWRTERRAFRPFDETTGCYLGPPVARGQKLAVETRSAHDLCID